MRSLAMLVPCVLAGCASQYAYTFQRSGPAVADSDLGADLAVDAAADAVELDLTNHTDQPLQIAWSDISLARADGTATSLRPDIDLGWIPPGAKLSAKLVPLALPHTGDAATAYEGQRFDLTLPAIVRREAKVYHFTLVAHVREL